MTEETKEAILICAEIDEKVRQFDLQQIERLRKQVSVLRAEVKAWRKHDDLHDCEDDRSRRLASIAAHDRACEAAQRTDAAGALEDK